MVEVVSGYALQSIRAAVSAPKLSGATGYVLQSDRLVATLCFQARLGSLLCWALQMYPTFG